MGLLLLLVFVQENSVLYPELRGNVACLVLSLLAAGIIVWCVKDLSSGKYWLTVMSMLSLIFLSKIGEYL